MSLTINESGDALAQTVDGITLPIDCSFEKVNGWIHGIEVHFEEVQALCLGMAAENDRLRAKLAAMESQEPGGKVTKWIDSNTAICSGEGFASAAVDADIFFKPVPADKPSRITEQDAREIAKSALSFWRNTVNLTLDVWMRDHAPALLNKLNAGRKQVPTFDLTCNNFLSMISGAIPVPDNITNEDEFYDWCKSLPDEQVPAVAVPDEWRGSLKEMVQAMRDYEMDVGEQAPEKHRRMMDTAEALLASPSHSQQSAATDAERFCDSHCTWRDHHPDCPSHESEK